MEIIRIYLNKRDVFTTDVRYISFTDKNKIKYTVSYNYYYENYRLKKDNKYILKDVDADEILNYIEKLDIETRDDYLRENYDEYFDNMEGV